LNPAEKIWHYIKQFFKNRVFENLTKLKEWLHDFIKDKLPQDIVKSITHNKFYNEAFADHFEM